MRRWTLRHTLSLSRSCLARWAEAARFGQVATSDAMAVATSVAQVATSVATPPTPSVRQPISRPASASLSPSSLARLWTHQQRYVGGEGGARSADKPESVTASCLTSVGAGVQAQRGLVSSEEGVLSESRAEEDESYILAAAFAGEIRDGLDCLGCI